MHEIQILAVIRLLSFIIFTTLLSILSKGEVKLIKCQKISFNC